jgi:hypothetical protein
MITREETRYAGHYCIRLANEALSLWVTRSVGPRILGLAPAGGENLFALLPDATAECPGVGTFSFRGGHRLWYAPEDPWRTYLPDDEPVTFSEIENGLRVTQPAEAPTGIQKSMQITLPGPQAHVVVDHTLRNRGDTAADLAPWAITQLKPGGMAVLPQTQELADEAGLLPNRHVVLWPYTRLESPHITWGEGCLLLEAVMEDGAFKVGFPNPGGYLAYAIDGYLFVKRAAYEPGAEYYDMGSSSECYCNPFLIELETLGPRTRLAPGQAVIHRETWEVSDQVAAQPSREELEALAIELRSGPDTSP